MATVRATCLLCECPVDVEPHEIVLHLGSANADSHRYGFTCPSCTVFVVRPAGPAVVEALLSTDVQLSTGHVPSWEEAGARPGVVLVDAGPHIEGIAEPAAPPLNDADLAAFHTLLDDDQALADWLLEA